MRYLLALILLFQGWDLERNHKHNSLPGLTWVSENEQLSCSQAIMNFLGAGLFDFLLDIRLDVVNEQLLCQLSNLDFRYWSSWDVFLLVRICQLVTISLISYITLLSSADPGKGPFNLRCAYDTFQPHGPATARKFQPLDRGWDC
jgi:hypothetical protein